MNAFAVVQRDVPVAALDIVGAGDDGYATKPKRVVENQQLSGVAFHGRATALAR